MKGTTDNKVTFLDGNQVPHEESFKTNRISNAVYQSASALYTFSVWDIGQWLLVSISFIAAINVGKISHIGNIGSTIGRYYKVNIISDTSKPDTVLPIYIGIGDICNHAFQCLFQRNHNFQCTISANYQFTL